MRYALLLALLCACPEHGSRPVGDASPPDSIPPELCQAKLEAALDRTCTVPTDCALIDHGDCCGTVKLGVRAGTEAAANAAEAAFQVCRACPPLGCAHPDMSEDGRVPAMGQAIVAICTASRCSSTVK